MKHDELVIVLHGLGRTPFSMYRVSRALRAEGYEVADWGYVSVKGTMHEQLARLRQRFAKVNGCKKVHGVGHSLGGLMLRGLFSQSHLPLGRLVMLGTPNSGASMVNRHGWLFNKGPLNRPIIHDLAAGSAAIAALPVPEMEIGVIAGVEKFHPLNPVAWINRSIFGDAPHDGTVEVSSARLPKMTDYMEVPANHSFIPLNRKAVKAAVNFINTGKFT